jgi:hypothetical protein
MDWNQAKDLVLGFLASGACALLIYEVHELRNSVTVLNQQIAVILERTASHEIRITKLEGNYDHES